MYQRSTGKRFTGLSWWQESFWVYSAASDLYLKTRLHRAAESSLNSSPSSVPSLPSRTSLPTSPNSMPVFCMKCPNCGEMETVEGKWAEIQQSIPICPTCGVAPMRRDYAEENVTSNFHPTKDLYAISLKQRAGKRANNRTSA